MDAQTLHDLVGALSTNIAQLSLGQQHMQQTVIQNASQNQEMQLQLAQALAHNQNNRSGLEKVAQGLKPPLFSGERDSIELDTWLFQVEEFYTTIGLVDEVQKVRAGGLMLKGQAASWYRDVMRRETTAIRTWRQFVEGVSRMFMPIGREKQARQQLDSAYQRSQDSVASYTTYFRRIVLAIGPGVSEEERLYRYVKGLRDPIQKEVYMREPSTFDEASYTAVRYEALHRTFRSKEAYQAAPTQSRSSGPAPMELGAMQAQSPSSKPKCYYCGRIGHLARECRKKNFDMGRQRKEKVGHRQGPSPHNR